MRSGYISLYITVIIAYLAVGHIALGTHVVYEPRIYCTVPMLRSQSTATFGKLNEFIRAVVQANAKFGFDLHIRYPAPQTFLSELSSDESQVIAIYSPITSSASVFLYTVGCANEAPRGVQLYEDIVAAFAEVVESR